MKELLTTLVFLVRDDEILLAMKKVGHGQGNYNGIGGKVDAGETIETAMIRECQEEITVTPISFEHVAELEFQQLYKGEAVRNICHTYVCTRWTGEPEETDEMAPRWFEVADIPYPQMWADDALWLPQVLAGQKLRGVFRYDDTDVLLSHEVTEGVVFK